jgi:hypothetical protein
MFQPFKEDVLHRRAEKLLGLSSLCGGFANISEASMESRVTKAKIAGSLLDVGFLAILLLSEKLFARALDLLFPVLCGTR